MRNSFKISLSISGTFIILFLMCANVNAQLPPDNQLSWDKNVLNDALTTRLVRWANDPNVNTEYTKYDVVKTCRALNYLALFAFHDKNNTKKKVTARLIEQLRYVISGAKEPCCRGVIAGWADNSLAQTITLAKYTDRVWSQFSKEEVEKFDLLMKALAIAGNYCQNSKNHVRRGLYQAFNWRKGWNPNHQEGYVGVIVAAWKYFGGADKVNAIFKNFDYNTYMEELKKAGFTNIMACWSATGKELMENGGEDSAGGKTSGVKMPFIYSSLSGFGEVEYDPYLLYRDLATRMFQYKVTSKECDGEAYIKDGTTSPYEGQTGMSFEFRTKDASGCRSSAGYCFDGLMNHMLTLAGLQAFNLLPDTKEHKALIDKLNVGVADLQYKLEHGYRGRKNGKFIEEDENKIKSLGSIYILDIYKVIKDKI